MTSLCEKLLYFFIFKATPHNVSGRVWFIETQSSLDYLISTYHDYKPYIVVLEPELFTRYSLYSIYVSMYF